MQISNVLQLTRTANLIADVQTRISTGKRVTAMSDPIVYYAAKSLSDRAANLLTVKDDIATTIGTIQTAVDGLSSADSILDQMRSVANQAKTATDASSRSGYQDQYNSLKTQLSSLVGDASYQGTNLISGDSQSHTVYLDEDKDSSYTISSTDSTADGLGVTEATDWDNADTAVGEAAIDADIALLDAAANTVAATSSSFSNSLVIVQTRSTFTDNMINTLEEGASKLVDTDLNEDSAVLLALQTRQALSVTAMSIQHESTKGILQLFGK